tara:strand:- start:116 stop:436 length:321 start_codon:yes stop_codon:yes gene_type:complete
MINETNDTYQYLKLQSDTFSESDLVTPYKKPIDIVLELNNLKVINSYLLGILLELNKDQISKGCCLVVVKSDLTHFSKRDSLNVVPSLREAEDYIHMEKIQRDLGY